jgi:uncharacterized protein YeaO (DUF488 family)
MLAERQGPGRGPQVPKVKRMKPDIRIKRIYETAAAADGLRLLVDRLWPRGISKARARLDGWPKELAPSTALRTWFHHAPGRWAEFERRYRAELRLQAAALAQLRAQATRQRVTLLYGARDALVNHAQVLRAVLLRKPASRGAVATARRAGAARPHSGAARRKAR